MRNVPVGAGRRKSKNSTVSQHHQLVIPGVSDGLIHHGMRPDGTLLAFGLDSPLPNQFKPPQNFLTNGFFNTDNEKNSSISLSNSDISVEKAGTCNGETLEGSQSVPCFPYSWNPIPWQPGFPVSFYSTSQWGENLAAGPCNLQWLPAPTMMSDQSSTNSSPKSTTLGKHSREVTTLMSSNTDNNVSLKDRESENSRVVIPKTLTIDDPSEAAKSSIWTTLGVNKNNHVSSSNGTVAFMGGIPQVKGVNNYERSNIVPGVEASSMVLQANPAAFSRSLAFHEIAQ